MRAVSLHLLQFLQRTQPFRYRHVGMGYRPVGVAHFAYVDVAARVEDNAVRREELPGLGFRAILAAKPRAQSAMLASRGAGSDSD